MKLEFITDKSNHSLMINNVSNNCMWCFKECNKREIVYTGDEDSQDGYEVWVYCDDCKTDTFHIIPKI